MLQVSLLGLTCSFFALPRTGGAFFINSTLDVAPSDSLNKPTPVCVNITEHPDWGPTLDVFDFDICQHAIQLIRPKVEGNIYTSYDFYSRQVYPDGPGPVGYKAWPLAQGAGVGKFKAAPTRLSSNRRLLLI